VTRSRGLDEDRLEVAKDRLRQMLNEHLAVVKPEAIARLGEGYQRGDTRNIDPHLTGRALQELERAGQIITAPANKTRGGAAVATIQPADQRKRRTTIEKAASRKRLLYARYLGWAAFSGGPGRLSGTGDVPLPREVIWEDLSYSSRHRPHQLGHVGTAPSWGRACSMANRLADFPRPTPPVSTAPGTTAWLNEYPEPPNKERT